MGAAFMKRNGRAVRRVGASLAALAVFGALLHGGASASSAASSQATWWKADLHVHSVFSADAFPDLGIIAQAAKAQGFNAIFLTDHNLGTNFPISNLTANNMTLTDILDASTHYFRRWTQATDGTLSSTTNQVSTADHFSGTNSLFLSSSSTSGGETFAWTKRGPNFRSQTGATSISFAVKPTRIDSGSSVYVSASIGGDPTVTSGPVGYTTADGISHPGKSTVFIWYLGAPPPTTLFPGATLHEISLGSPVLNTWKSYSINVSDAVASLPTAEQSLDYDALSDLKIATSANNGTVSAFFDNYAVEAPTATNLGATLAADEFIYRNGIIDAGTYDTSTFKFLPALEAGVSEHANRFNFDIKAPGDYVSYQNGIDSISVTQGTGYPAQLNHPGVSGGVTDGQATSSNAEGADLMEVRQQNMITDWDAILRQTHPLTLIGTWGGDNHVGSWSAASQSTFIYAPTLTLDSLLHAVYEGRTYLGPSSFSTGEMAFNLDQQSTTPYPARYPVYVGQAAASETVHLGIAGGLSSGDVVTWLSNGGSTTTTSTLATDSTAGASYTASKAVPIGGTSTYVRAEVRNKNNGLKGLTQPIVFKPVSGLPADKSIHVDSVTPASGCQCSLLQTKGITAATWNGTTSAFSLSLVNPANSTVELLGKSANAPTAVSADGAAVNESTSLASFQSATGDAWFYDASSQSLYIQDVQNATSSSVVVSFGSSGGDVTPPSVPTGVNGSPVGSSEVDLSWTASTDNAGGSGVAGYNVFRDGSKVNGALVTSTSFNDTGLQPSTQYGYTVSAVDNQGNESAQSSPAKLVTTGSSGGGGAVAVLLADSYVDSSAPSTNYGSNVKLRVDTSPTVNSYLRFNVTGLSGAAAGVTLKIFATSSLSAGFEVHALSDDTWGESTITSANAPAAGALLATSGVATANSYVSVALPLSAVSGNGDVNFVLIGRSSTALAMASRETATPPQLVVTSSGGGGGDTTPPSVPTGVNGTPVGSSEIDLSWTGSTDNTGGTGVAGYNVYRGGVKVNSSLVTATSFNDTGLAASTQYSYTVSAVDNATNESAQSTPPKQVTTGSGGGGGGGTFTPIADSYVDASVPSTNFGSNAKLRVDTSPIVNSYLRFDVSGLSGSVTGVTLKIYATSALSAGFEVHALADDTWVESTITSANAPAAGALLATSPAAVANSYVTVTLPLSAVSGNGHVDFVLVGRSTTALALASRESVATPPQLVVASS